MEDNVPQSILYCLLYNQSSSSISVRLFKISALFLNVYEMFMTCFAVNIAIEIIITDVCMCLYLNALEGLFHLYVYRVGWNL